MWQNGVVFLLYSYSARILHLDIILLLQCDVQVPYEYKYNKIWIAHTLLRVQLVRRRVQDSYLYSNAGKQVLQSEKLVKSRLAKNA